MDIVTPQGERFIKTDIHEDELLDMLSELPGQSQIDNIVRRLQVRSLRDMSSSLLWNSVETARDPHRYHEFVSELVSWVATAQEIIASRPARSHER